MPRSNEKKSSSESGMSDFDSQMIDELKKLDENMAPLPPEAPVVLDYHSPQKLSREAVPRHYFAWFFVGCVLGVVGALLTEGILSVIYTGGWDFPIVLVVHLLISITLIVKKETRPMGIGYLLGIPLVILIALSCCAAIVMTK